MGGGDGDEVSDAEGGGVDIYATILDSGEIFGIGLKKGQPVAESVGSGEAAFSTFG